MGRCTWTSSVVCTPWRNILLYYSTFTAIRLIGSVRNNLFRIDEHVPRRLCENTQRNIIVTSSDYQTSHMVRRELFNRRNITSRCNTCLLVYAHDRSVFKSNAPYCTFSSICGFVFYLLFRKRSKCGHFLIFIFSNGFITVFDCEHIQTLFRRQ